MTSDASDPCTECTHPIGHYESCSQYHHLFPKGNMKDYQLQESVGKTHLFEHEGVEYFLSTTTYHHDDFFVTLISTDGSVRLHQSFNGAGVIGDLDVRDVARRMLAIKATGDCKMETFKAYARHWLETFNNVIKPMRVEADAGKESYAKYDEAYNEHLEELHGGVAQLLDQ